MGGRRLPGQGHVEVRGVACKCAPASRSTPPKRALHSRRPMSARPTRRRAASAAARNLVASSSTCPRANPSTTPASGQHGWASLRATLPTRMARKSLSTASGTTPQATQHSLTMNSLTTLRLGGGIPSCKRGKVALRLTQARQAFCGTRSLFSTLSAKQVTTASVRQLQGKQGGMH